MTSNPVDDGCRRFRIHSSGAIRQGSSAHQIGKPKTKKKVHRPPLGGGSICASNSQIHRRRSGTAGRIVQKISTGEALVTAYFGTGCGRTWYRNRTRPPSTANVQNVRCDIGIALSITIFGPKLMKYPQRRNAIGTSDSNVTMVRARLARSRLTPGSYTRPCRS